MLCAYHGTLPWKIVLFLPNNVLFTIQPSYLYKKLKMNLLIFSGQNVKFHSRRKTDAFIDLFLYFYTVCLSYCLYNHVYGWVSQRPSAVVASNFRRNASSHRVKSHNGGWRGKFFPFLLLTEFCLKKTMKTIY